MVYLKEKKIIIKDVKAFVTNPAGRNFTVVKVYTDKGITGIGCASFQQRSLMVKEMIDCYLKPILLGLDASNIEDIWQMMRNNAYWRNGPVINNAIAGIDMALWDIKAKQADLPLYQILGGKSRNYISLYSHNLGETLDEMLESVTSLKDEGFKYIRLQYVRTGGSRQKFIDNGELLRGNYVDEQAYIKETCQLFKAVREKFGDSIELLHDVHERLKTPDAIRLARVLEPFHLYFLEDPIAPDYLKDLGKIKDAAKVPLAFGELLNNPLEFVEVMQQGKIDYLRIHVSQAGGITPTLKLAHMAELLGLQIVFHTPIDLSPVGIAVNNHLSMHLGNVAIQEYERISATTKQIFPGEIPVEKGKMYPINNLGIGIDFNEELAKEFPNRYRVHEWTQNRFSDGRIQHP